MKGLCFILTVLAAVKAQGVAEDVEGGSLSRTADNSEHDETLASGIRSEQYIKKPDGAHQDDAEHGIIRVNEKDWYRMDPSRDFASAADDTQEQGEDVNYDDYDSSSEMPSCEAFDNFNKMVQLQIQADKDQGNVLANVKDKSNCHDTKAAAKLLLQPMSSEINETYVQYYNEKQKITKDNEEQAAANLWKENGASGKLKDLLRTAGVDVGFGCVYIGQYATCVFSSPPNSDDLAASELGGPAAAALQAQQLEELFAS